MGTKLACLQSRPVHDRECEKNFEINNATPQTIVNLKTGLKEAQNKITPFTNYISNMFQTEVQYVCISDNELPKDLL